MELDQDHRPHGALSPACRRDIGKEVAPRNCGEGRVMQVARAAFARMGLGAFPSDCSGGREGSKPGLAGLTRKASQSKYNLFSHTWNSHCIAQALKSELLGGVRALPADPRVL